MMVLQLRQGEATKLLSSKQPLVRYVVFRWSELTFMDDQTVYLPVKGLVDEPLTPGDLIGVNKDTFLIFEKLPTESV